MEFEQGRGIFHGILQILYRWKQTSYKKWNEKNENNILALGLETGLSLKYNFSGSAVIGTAHVILD